MESITANIIGSEKYLICTPLTGSDRSQLASQLQLALLKQPDIIEWRADFFNDVSKPSSVIKVLAWLQSAACGLPFIFTLRSQQEGGQSNGLTDRQILELTEAVCRQTSVDYVDCELRHECSAISNLAAAAHQWGTQVIGSFHDFKATPSKLQIIDKILQAESYGLDIAKVAVMPQTMEDVLTLLSATIAAKQQVSIPLITVSMGQDGMISRVVGAACGSALTFASLAQESAPGQLAIDDLRTILRLLPR